MHSASAVPSLDPLTAGASLSLSPFLSFRAAGELFATPIGGVREIIEACHITEIPLTPKFMKGVINLRGSVVPVVDLAARFGRESSSSARTGTDHLYGTRLSSESGTDQSASEQKPCIIIAEIKSDDRIQLLGAFVDSAEDVIETEASQLEPQPDFGAGLRSDFVLGMLTIDEQFVIVLDFDKVFSPAELERLVQAAAMPAAPEDDVNAA